MARKSRQESFTRPKKLQALVDTETMKCTAGLSATDIKDLKTKELSMIYQITLTLINHILLGFKHRYV
jgi:hypothetical protein